MFMKKQLIILLVVLVAAGGVIFWGWNSQRQVVLAPTPNQAEQAVEYQTTVAIEYVTDEPVVISYEQGQTALGVLRKLDEEVGVGLQTEDYGEFGILVTGFDEYENGDNNNYWHYYVNDALPMVGAGNYEVQPGDVIEWRFHESEF